MCLISPLSADIISTVEFNHDGEFLATGDKGGRVVIFQRDGTKMRVKLNMYLYVTSSVPLSQLGSQLV